MNIITNATADTTTDAPADLPFDPQIDDYGPNYPLDGNAACKNCSCEFTPRKQSGGKPQVYCSTECRREADAERKANAANAPQRAEPKKPPAEHIEPETGRAPEAFDWEVHIVAPSQAAIAIYENEAGAVVIRQEGQYSPDEDVWIIVQPQNLGAVIRKLQEMQQEMQRSGGA
jgi:hypothetical protein